MLEETDLHEEPPPPAPPKRRRGLRLLLVLVLVFAVIAGAGAGYVAWAMGGTSNGATVRVIIPEGASGAEIASILQRNKIIRSSFIFRVVARLRGVSTNLKPGAYELRVGMGVNAALDALKNGVPLKTFRFTIPEGKTVSEIAAIVAAHTPITAAQFLEACRSGRHRLPIMPKGSNNLEGLLFPKTYLLVEKTTADELVEMMLHQFTIDTEGLDFSKAAALHITPYQVVVVASLIEREAKVERDRPLIASVIYNRLARPMRLQIDATVEYAILVQTGHYKYPLTTDDYTNVHSPYNTYLVDGLPPAPIASPGLAALQAALNPAATSFYYYVLTSDQKSHCFARNQTEFDRCRAAA